MSKKEKKPMKKSKKVLLGIGITLLAAILIYLIAWGLNYYRYYKWEMATGYDEKRHSYVYVEDDYMYSVGEPNFPSFTGNFSIAHSIGGLNEKEGVQFCVIIWPKFDGSYDIGVEVVLVEWNEKRKQFEYNGYQVMLDENLDLDLKGRTEFTEDEKKMIQGYHDNKDELYKLLDKARELWGIMEE